MSKITKLFFIVSAIGLILFAACTNEEVCDSTALNPGIDRTFAFDGIVKHNNLNEYTGSVTLTMYKTYCNGSENGRKVITVETNYLGQWNSNWLQTYTYTNIDDKVTLEVYIDDQNSESYTWAWSDVDDEFPNGFVYFTSNMILDY